MAVADVGVAIGPRNRRRLSTTTIAVAVVALLSSVLLWKGGVIFSARSAHRSGPAVERHLILIPDKLTYGMTPQQVLRRIGRPERIAGDCWQYGENVKNFVGQTINAVRVCFLSKAYSDDYLQVNGRWREPGSTRIVIAPPTH